MNSPGHPNLIFGIAARLIAILFSITLILACVSMFEHPGHVDFLSYWAAGRLVLLGQAFAAYDVSAHRAVELGMVPRFGLIPFPYPPVFLFAVTPFALFPLWLSFALWLFVTIGAFLASVRRFSDPVIAIAHPSTLINVLIGQNGFLTAGLFTGGMSLLKKRPIAAGAVLGLLSYKPQLTPLIPVALIAGREWKALAAAAFSTTALWLSALAAFGPTSYAGFIRMLPLYMEYAAAGAWQWKELASPFAFFRFFEASPVSALIAQGLIALGAAAVISWLWWARADGRVAALAAATLLIPPYLFTYDALLLAVAFGWLVERKRYIEFAVSWLLCLLPATASFGAYSGPNTVPLSAIICLVTVVLRHRSLEKKPHSLFNQPPPATTA